MGSILDQLRDYQPDQSLTNQGPTTGRFQTALRSMSDGQYDPSKGWLGPQAVDVVAMVGDMALAEYEKQMEKDTFLKRALGVASIPAEAAMAMGRGVRDSIAGGTKALLDIDSRHMNNPEIMRYATEKSFDTAANAPVLGGAASFVLNSAIPPKGALGMNVWQGGPHKYGPKGASESLQHMSKGEGQQAYGWGRYDAGAKGTAKQYQETLTDLRASKANSALSKAGGDVDVAIQQTKAKIDGIRSLPNQGNDPAAQSRFIQSGEETLAELNALKAGGNLGEGYLYKHDLPDEDIARYLDWDKPLSEQPESVRAALKLGNFPGAERARASIIADDTGEWFLSALDADMGSQQAASEALGKVGIPGLKYYDGMSRNVESGYKVTNPNGTTAVWADEGEATTAINEFMRYNKGSAKPTMEKLPDQTRNYVTWDQDVLDRMKLLERNGETFSANPRNASLVGSLTALDRQRNLPSNAASLLAGPKLTKEQYERFAASNSKRRRKWGDESKALYADMNATKVARYGNRPKDPLLAQQNFRGYRAKNLKAEKQVDEMHGGLWSSKFADDVRTDTSGGWDSTGSINRANMESVPRQLKKEGWTVRHASKGGSGKKSSRYVVSPDGKYEVRLSDHELPNTPQRQHNREQTGGARWDDEVVLYGDESPQQIIDQIKAMHGETFSANPAPISVLGILDEIERAQEMKDFVARGGA